MSSHSNEEDNDARDRTRVKPVGKAPNVEMIGSCSDFLNNGSQHHVVKLQYTLNCDAVFQAPRDQNGTTGRNAVQPRKDPTRADAVVRTVSMSRVTASVIVAGVMWTLGHF